MIVRAATSEDVPDLLRHGRDWWAQLPHSIKIPYSAESVRKTLEVLQGNNMLVVIEVDLRVVGFAGGVVNELYMNAKYKTGSELFWYVVPEFRSKGVGKELLLALEGAAKANGCIYWSMIAMQSHDPERAGAIYERAGYTWTERTYTKEL